MSELDKDCGIDANENSQNRENNDLFKEETYNVQDNKDIKESDQDTEKELCEEIENNVTQEKDSVCKEEGSHEKSESNSEKTETNTEEIRSNETVNTEYSSFYKPPYYVPNFTVNDSSIHDNADIDTDISVRNSKRKRSRTIIAVCLIVALLISAFAFGAFSMGKLMNFDKNGSSNTLDLGKEGEIVVVQNHPQMNIVKNPNTDYVPQNLPEVVQMVGNSVVEYSCLISLNIRMQKRQSSLSI